MNNNKNTILNNGKIIKAKRSNSNKLSRSGSELDSHRLQPVMDDHRELINPDTVIVRVFYSFYFKFYTKTKNYSAIYRM